MARQGFLDQQVLNFFQAEVFNASGSGPLAFQAKIDGLNVVAGAHQNSALRGVIKFSDVAGPGVIQHLLQCRRLEALYRLAISLRIQLEKVCSQQRDIFFTFAQRRNRKLDRVESEKQVWAEPA